jgi:hypothetical protein
MTKFTKEEIESQCSAEYEGAVGKVVLISEIECYDEDLNNVTVQCAPPVIARIGTYDGGSTDQCVIRWMDDENCDPVYDIEILEFHPAFGEAKARPSWIYGTSRSTSGTIEQAPFVIADEATQEAYEDAEPVRFNDDGSKTELDSAPAYSIKP